MRRAASVTPGEPIAAGQDETAAAGEGLVRAIGTGALAANVNLVVGGRHLRAAGAGGHPGGLGRPLRLHRLRCW